MERCDNIVFKMKHVASESIPSAGEKLCKRYSSVFVGPCNHGMARPQVADGGTAPEMEGSCE